jgi:Uma2 family endonuclease
MLSCDPSDDDNKILKFPTIIIEVLSSNASHDKNFKWRNYRKLPSLRYYLLVSQDDYYIEMYARNKGNTFWTLSDFDSLDDIISFPDLEFELPLNVIYEGIQ